MALAADGRVWAWGRGKYGALGHDTLDNRFVPEQIKALHASPVIAIASGGNHSVALSAKRRVYSWGSNQWGQLGVGNTIDANMPVVLEGSHTWRITHVRLPLLLRPPAPTGCFLPRCMQYLLACSPRQASAESMRYWDTMAVSTRYVSRQMEGDFFLDLTIEL